MSNYETTTATAAVVAPVAVASVVAAAMVLEVRIPTQLIKLPFAILVTTAKVVITAHRQQRLCVIPNGGQDLMYLKVHYDKLVNGSKKHRHEYLLYQLTLFSVTRFSKTSNNNNVLSHTCHTTGLAL